MLYPKNKIMILLDGKHVSQSFYQRIKELSMDNTPELKLVVILVGDKEDSKVYVNMKKRKCREYGIDVDLIHFESDTLKEVIIDSIQQYNNDSAVTGLMVQLPLPEQLQEDTREILDNIDPSKDVDGLTSSNMGKICLNRDDTYYQCTPLGILELLKYYEIPIEGSDVVIVGKSQIVGLPLSIMLSNLDATVSLCHIKTKDLKSYTQKADILVVCCGVPKLITEDHIKEGVTIIDVGINVIGQSKSGKRIICGDVDFEGVKDKVKAITPVPGGVGPMTICMLIKQISGF